LAIVEPFFNIVKLFVEKLPVPSVTNIVLPKFGEAGKVKLKGPPDVLARYCVFPIAFVFAVIIVYGAIVPVIP
jgi:hypothetical protein